MLEIYKAELKQFVEAVKKADKEKTENKNTYQDFLQMNEAVDNKLKQTRKDLLQRTKALYQEEQARLYKKWNELNGDQVNQADLELLKLDLPVEAQKQFIDKYSSNGTMLRMIKYTLKEQNKAMWKNLPTEETEKVKAEEEYRAVDKYSSVLLGDDLFTKGIVEKTIEAL